MKAVSEPVRVIIADDELISRGYMEMFIQPSPRYEIAASMYRNALLDAGMAFGVK